MKLYLLRHGTAEPHTAEPAEDPLRALVDKGRHQCRLAARLLARLQVVPEVVMSSPYRRARETAQEVLAHLGLELTIVEEPRLAPGTPAAEAVAAVLAAGEQSVLCTGHEPLLSEMVALLIGEGEVRLDLRKGGLVELAVESRKPPRGALVGLLRPGYLER